MRKFNQGDEADHDSYFRFTGRARLSRDMHILEGFLQGIAADHKVQDVELKCLTKWLSEHREFADRHPFSEVIPRIQKIIVQGIVDEEERADLLWISNKFHTADEYYDNVTSEMQRLHGMLAGILSDGRITEDELRTLDKWIAERACLRHCWPYDQLEAIIAHVMEDGKIDAQEHEALMQFFGEFVSSAERKAVGVVERDVTVSGVCTMYPVISFEDRRFCFTGASKRCKKDELAWIVVELGGSFHKNLRGDTDYLVVNEDGNPCWTYACYGRKIEEAVERQRDGQNLAIVHEHDFWEAARVTPEDILTGYEPVAHKPVAADSGRAAKPQRQKNEHVTNVTSCSGSQLAGKTLVVTGTLQKYKREEIESLIVQHGGRAASSISKKTDYLIAGEKAGSKLDKARTLGVRVISEVEFDKLISS